MKQTVLEKDLDIWVDTELTFSRHCGNQGAKANRTLGMIRRAYSYLDGGSLMCLYTFLVRPSLECGYPAWAPLYHKDCELLENAQRRATKDKPYSSYRACFTGDPEET